MSYKKWNVYLLFFLMFVCTNVILFNFFIDPLWIFPNSISGFQFQISFNERAQKSNQISSNPFEYDAILVGSSITSFINHKDFGGLRTYNFAVSSMMPEEYEDYIEYAKKMNGRDFKYIIIGFDFFGTNGLMERTYLKPEYYLRNADSLWYKMKGLLQVDTIKYSIRCLEIPNADKRIDYYDRNNIKYMKNVSSITRKNAIIGQKKYYAEFYSNNKYLYDESFAKKMLSLKNKNPNSRFVVFTTPTSEPLLDVINDSDRNRDYYRWLAEIIEIFGEVHHFAYKNDFTTNLSYYADGEHFLPQNGKRLVSAILNEACIEQCQEQGDVNLGIQLTKKNLLEHIRLHGK